VSEKLEIMPIHEKEGEGVLSFESSDSRGTVIT
jgi:hypothetical protein